MAPVVGLIDKPDGSDPLVIDQELDAPPVLAGEFVPIPLFLAHGNGEPR